jgi:hypothetical protein
MLLAALALSGCAGRIFTEADSRQTLQVDVGSTFSIRVPAPSGPAPLPSFKGGVLKAGPGLAEDGHLTYEFQALGLGETEVRIGPDYSWRIQVVSASQHSGMLMNRP